MIRETMRGVDGGYYADDFAAMPMPDGLTGSVPRYVRKSAPPRTNERMRADGRPRPLPESIEQQYGAGKLLIRSIFVPDIGPVLKKIDHTLAAEAAARTMDDDARFASDLARIIHEQREPALTAGR